MSTTIPGDSRTFAHHVLTLNLDQIFHHDIPKVLGIANHEAKVLRDGWAKLDLQTQNALLHGSGILDVIGKDLAAAPDDIVNGILAKFTDITKEDLQNTLAKFQGIFTGVEATLGQDAATTVQNIVDYLNKTVGLGAKLNSLLSTGAQILAVVFHPDSIIAQVATYAETAYQIIKNIFGKK